ncbi:MAG: hypothetical protein ACK5Z5_04605 [Neisseriaceae bacterium]
MGMWCNGKINGEGVLKYSDKNEFHGKVNDEYVPDGEGRLIFFSKKECRGILDNGNLNGNVELIYPDGTIFKGYVDDNYMPE